MRDLVVADFVDWLECQHTRIVRKPVSITSGYRVLRGISFDMAAVKRKLEEQCGTIEEAMRKSTEHPPDVVGMLIDSNIVNSLGVGKENRHEYQVKVVEMVGGVLNGVESNLQKAVDDAESKLLVAKAELARLKAGALANYKELVERTDRFPNDIPLWIKLPELWRPSRGLEGMPRIALVISTGSRGTEYPNGADALAHILGSDAVLVEELDDCDGSGYPEINRALKKVANEKEGVVIACCRSQRAWAIGISSKLTNRHNAAKAALAAILVIKREDANEELDMDQFPGIVALADTARGAATANLEE